MENSSLNWGTKASVGMTVFRDNSCKNWWVMCPHVTLPDECLFVLAKTATPQVLSLQSLCSCCSCCYTLLSWSLSLPWVGKLDPALLRGPQTTRGWPLPPLCHQWGTPCLEWWEPFPSPELGPPPLSLLGLRWQEAPGMLTFVLLMQGEGVVWVEQPQLGKHSPPWL